MSEDESILLKSILWTLYVYNGYKEDYSLFKDLLVDNYPNITEDALKDELEGMLYILYESEQQLGYYKDEFEYEQNLELLGDEWRN